MRISRTELLPSAAHGISRRRLLRYGLLLAGGLSLQPGFSQLSAAETARPIVETHAGKLRGVQRAGVNIFRGIPYGADTGGANRFRPPRPATRWAGVREATEYGPSAPQSLAPGGRLSPGQSEDCLRLNIWTPALDGARRPVMFWCHGGGFSRLSGSSPSYDGSNLCQRGDVVVVTVNHRLNVMGFSHLAPLLGEEFKGGGNAGMLDLVQALEWVRDNIARFGGDPGRVMVFGESGGGRKVGTLLAMPAARGLFHRAAIQSGPSLQVVEEEAASELGGRLLKRLGINRNRPARLQELPAEQIIAAYLELARETAYEPMAAGFAPVVDGFALPSHPFHPQASAVNPDIPLIVGANRTEMTYQLRSDAAAFNLDETGLRARVGRILGERADPVIEAYRDSQPGLSPSELFFLIASDARYVVPSTHIAERRAALNTAPVFNYYLTWQTETRDGRLMTPHALDIPFVFDNTDPEHTVLDFTTGSASERALAARVSATWIEFARSGRPQAGTLPDWPRYNADSRPTMVIDNHSQVVHDPLGPRREAMSAALGLS